MKTFSLLVCWGAGYGGGNQSITETQAPSMGHAMAHMRAYRPELDDNGYCKVDGFTYVVAEHFSAF